MYEASTGCESGRSISVPNPRFLFLTPRQREALSNLRYGLTAPRGLTLLIGEAGTARRRCCTPRSATSDDSEVRAAQQSDADARGVLRVPRPRLRSERRMRALRRPGSCSSSSATCRSATGRRRDALIIDEAQSLPYELLEEVRLLEQHRNVDVKLLNVVLAGQPELADRLNEQSLRQLKQRIALRCELKPLDFRETAAYIAGRLRIAGGNAARSSPAKRWSRSTRPRPGSRARQRDLRQRADRRVRPADQAGRHRASSARSAAISTCRPAAAPAVGAPPGGRGTARRRSGVRTAECCRSTTDGRHRHPRGAARRRRERPSAPRTDAIGKKRRFLFF